MYQLFPANEYIEQFTDIYLTDEQFKNLSHILCYMPKVRPFWGNTKYRYIIENHIYFWGCSRLAVMLDYKNEDNSL